MAIVAEKLLLHAPNNAHAYRQIRGHSELTVAKSPQHSLNGRDWDGSRAAVRPPPKFDIRVVPYEFTFSICSACLREVSVSLAPLNMRATSSVRSSPVMSRTPVRVRSAELFFSIR